MSLYYWGHDLAVLNGSYGPGCWLPKINTSWRLKLRFLFWCFWLKSLLPFDVQFLLEVLGSNWLTYLLTERINTRCKSCFSDLHWLKCTGRYTVTSQVGVVSTRAAQWNILIFSSVLSHSTDHNIRSHDTRVMWPQPWPVAAAPAKYVSL